MFSMCVWLLSVYVSTFLHTHANGFLEISACVCVRWMLWQCACAAVPFSSLLIDLVDPAA